MTDHTTTTTPAVRGRPFAKGNGGRRPGTKNRSSLILAALMDGEQEELVRKGLEIAKAGDVSMLKFFLSRILPRERPITIDLPQMEFADDAVEALGAHRARRFGGIDQPERRGRCGEPGKLLRPRDRYGRRSQEAGRVRGADQRERIA